MNTKEELFQFEKEKQPLFDEFYRSKGWEFKRIVGIKNKDYDVLVKIGEEWVGVEEKFRGEEYLDLLVELIQDTETNDPGWLYTTKAKYLFYGVGNKIYGMYIDRLREFVELYKDKFNVIISPKGWGITKNIAIPWPTIFDNNLGKRMK